MKHFLTNLLLLLHFLPTLSLTIIAQTPQAFKPKKVYKSNILVINQISINTFIHTSYKQTDDFGKVPCNGLIVRDGKEVVIFDTPADNSSAEALIDWINGKLQCQIKAVIPTHFHDDCLGGLNAFHDHQVPSYASYKTIELATANNETIPQNGFSDSLRLSAGSQYVTAVYFGEGHTADNVVGYFPAENILFGGCLIKALDASKGYLGDANVSSWSDTVEKVKAAYPKAKLVVPGHGDAGGVQLLDYTIQLFKNP